MNLEMTETQALLQASADKIAAGEGARLRIPHGAKAPSDCWKRLADAGFTALPIGENASFHDSAAVLTRFGYHGLLEPYIPSVILSATVLERLPDAGGDLLARLASGEIVAALAHPEQQRQAAALDIQTRLIRDGDRLRIIGRKRMVLAGDRADMLLVTGTIEGPDGAAMLAVAAIEAAAAGIDMQTYTLFDGSSAADITFDEVAVSDASLLASGSIVQEALDAAFDRAAAAICADSVGAMSRLFELTLEHLKTRKQFGVVIGSFQVLQHRAVDMYVALEQARSMSILAADVADNVSSTDRASSISAAKVQICRSSRFVVESALQLHGAMGFTDEYEGSSHVRRLLTNEQYFGNLRDHLDRYELGGV